MTRYFLGVDTGATKTHAMLATDQGEVAAVGEGGCGNHEMVGYKGLRQVLDQTLTDALQQAGIGKEQIAGAGFGIAGYDWPSERADTLQAIASLGLSCPVDAVNDTVIGLVAGTKAGWGVVIDAGTGNNVRGLDAQGHEVQVTGCGSAFGEYGGAVDIIFRAVQVICYEWHGRGPQTQLSPALVSLVGAKDLPDLIEGLSQGWYQLDAGAARLVFEVAERGDPVAREAIRWVAEEQAETSCGVIRKLGIADQEFEIILIGSTFNGGPLYTQPLMDTIWRTAPRAKFVRLQAPPAAGGVLIGMRLAGVDPAPLREPLVHSALDWFSAHRSLS